MSGDLVHDRAEIRNSADDDADRLVRRVYAALNSGRDADVVQVVLDETDRLRREVETLREGNRVACGRFEVAEAALIASRAALAFKDGTIEDLSALIEGMRDMNCGCVG